MRRVSNRGHCQIDAAKGDRNFHWSVVSCKNALTEPSKPERRRIVVVFISKKYRFQKVVWGERSDFSLEAFFSVKA